MRLEGVSIEVGGTWGRRLVCCLFNQELQFFLPPGHKKNKKRRRKKNRYSASFPHLFSYLFSLCLFSFQARRFEFFPQWVFPPQALFFSPKAKVQRRKPGRKWKKNFLRCHKTASFGGSCTVSQLHLARRSQLVSTSAKENHEK